MVIKPFDLEAALRGEPVVTATGLNVSNLKVTRGNNALLEGLVESMNTVYNFDAKTGKSDVHDNYDLMMVHFNKVVTPNPRPHSHYHKDVSKLTSVDVYQVCQLFNVDDPSVAVSAVRKINCKI